MFCQLRASTHSEGRAATNRCSSSANFSRRNSRELSEASGFDATACASNSSTARRRAASSQTRKSRSRKRGGAYGETICNGRRMVASVRKCVRRMSWRGGRGPKAGGSRPGGGEARVGGGPAAGGGQGGGGRP